MRGWRSAYVCRLPFREIQRIFEDFTVRNLAEEGLRGSEEHVLAVEVEPLQRVVVTHPDLPVLGIVTPDGIEEPQTCCQAPAVRPGLKAIIASAMAHSRQFRVAFDRAPGP